MNQPLLPEEELEVPALVDASLVSDIISVLKALLFSEYNRYQAEEDDKAKTHAVQNVLKLAGEIRMYSKQLMVYEPWKRDMLSRIRLREAISLERFKRATGDEETVEVVFNVPELFVLDAQQRLAKIKELEEELHRKDEEARKVLGLTK